MTATQITAQIAQARELMQTMIQLGFGTEMRERQERRINALKAKLATTTEESTVTASTEDRIIAAYNKLAPARGELVSLAKLRAEIAGIAKDEQDRALKALDRARVLNLESDPNRKALPDNVADWQMVIGGQAYHLVYAA